MEKTGPKVMHFPFYFFVFSAAFELIKYFHNMIYKSEKYAKPITATCRAREPEVILRLRCLVSLLCPPHSTQKASRGDGSRWMTGGSCTSKIHWY